MSAVDTDNKLVVFAVNLSPRLSYILDWIFTERLGIAYSLTDSETDLQGVSFFIAYGRTFSNAFNIPDANLLWEKKVVSHNIAVGEWNGLPTLYSTSGNNYSISFDIFSAAFFLISRYEEYYEFTPDKHDRYPATDSILYKNGWLRRPIADEWITALGAALSAHGVALKLPEFSFQPTYDIDIAFSYLHKGRRRTIGAFFRDLLKGNFNLLQERLLVARGKQQDPYDSFDMLHHWHEEYRYQPLFFILASLQTTDFDKNISPSHPHMQHLIGELADKGELGMHPSYYSGKYPDYWHKEKEALEDIIDRPVTLSRQHYIKMVVPGTYQFLEKNNIAHDYSMGYGTHLGFRAGTGSSFRFYDLNAEKALKIRVEPFCFMDTTARYEEKMNCTQAFEVLNEIKKLLQQCNSHLITIFHNFSLGTDRDWTGWKKSYRDFIDR